MLQLRDHEQRLVKLEIRAVKKFSRLFDDLFEAFSHLLRVGRVAAQEPRQPSQQRWLFGRCRCVAARYVSHDAAVPA